MSPAAHPHPHRTPRSLSDWAVSVCAAAAAPVHARIQIRIRNGAIVLVGCSGMIDA